jgi:hypothetical protein
MKQEKISIVLLMLLVLSPVMAVATPLAHSVSLPLPGHAWWDEVRNVGGVVINNTETVDPHVNDTLVLKDYTWTDLNTIIVNFTVKNIYNYPMDKVEVHIYETLSNGAFFHVLNASGLGGGTTWTATKLEADTKGWHRLIKFDVPAGPPAITFPVNGTAVFSLSLGAYDALAGAVTGANAVEKYYRFVVTMSGEGGSKDQNIYLTFDYWPPTVDITQPANGSSIVGDLLPFCGNNYFKVTWQANDSTGLWYYNFLLNRTSDGLTWAYNSSHAMPLTTNNSLYSWSETFTTINFTDPMDGPYTVDVWVADRVGNIEHKSIQFTYTHPQKPFWLTTPPPYTAKGFAALDTQWNATSQLVESKQVVYGNKTLGTNVTASGYGWKPNATVTITMRIVTYDNFSTSDYEVLVAKATVDTSGNFTTWFIVPKAPAGIYNVTAKSSSTDPSYVTTCAATFEILPEIILNPNPVIGPALVNVEATGFTSVAETSSGRVLILCNNKDSLIGVNLQTLSFWYFDANGTLQNILSLPAYPYGGIGRHVDNGIFWPAMQPGTYNITLFLNTAGRWWNLTHWETKTTFEFNNTMTVTDTLSLLQPIKDQLNTLNATIVSINGNVATINTAVGRIETKIDAITPIIARIDGNLVTINTTIGTFNTTLSSINAKVSTINWNDIATITTDVGIIKGNVTSVDGPIMTVKSDVGDIKAQVPGLTTPIYIAVALSLIAAIAAIACAILVYRKIA